MKTNWISLISVIIILSGCATQKSMSIKSEGEALFEDPSTFFIDGEAKWSFEKDGICNILNTGDGFLITNKKYNSFQLEFEFNPDAVVNSGIFIRCKGNEMSYEDCYELNIWDDHPNQSNRTGSIVNRATASTNVSTIGKWNTMKVMAKGTNIQIWINNILTMNYSEAVSRPGVIGFQAFEAGNICFRNIQIKEY